MTIFGNSCGSCPDPGYVNQTVIAGNAPVIGAGGPPAAGADPSASPQTVINIYDDKVRIFVSNDGVTWSHADLNSLTCEDLNTCSITNLSDVDTVSTPPASGQFLQWDGADWVPAAQADVHFFNTNLSSGANRTHLLNENFVLIYGNTDFNNGSQFFINTDGVSLGGGTGDFGGNDYTYLNVGSNMEFVFQNNAEMHFGGQAGLAGWVLTSNGANSGPTWQAIPQVNITTGSLAAATGSRTVNLGSNTLLFDNVTTFVLDANDSNIYGGLALYGQGASNSFFQLYDSDDSQYVALTVPSGVSSSYTLTMPSGPPASNGQVLAFTTAGVGSFVDNLDTNITTGTLAAATTTRNIDFDGNDLNFNNTGAFNVDASFTSLTGSYTAVRGNGAVGALRLYDADNSHYVAFVPRTATTTTYTITLPVAPPSANDQVMSFQTNGLANFVDPPNITTGTLAAAAGNRTVDMNTRGLTFSNVDWFIVSGGSGSSISLNTDFVGISRTGAAAGQINLYDADNSASVAIRSPLVATTYTITLPDAAPASNGQVLSFTTAGVASFVNDQHFLNTDLTATADRTHELSQNRLTINGDGGDASSFVIDNQGIFIYGGSNTNNAEVNVDSSGIDLRFTGTTHLAIEGSSGSNGQVLTSQGFGSAPAWVTPQANHSVTYTDDSASAYDIVADAGSGNGGPSNRPGSPIEGDEVIELYSNGILKEIYDGSQWISTFNSSCCSAATISLTNGVLSPLDPEVPTTLEIQTYYDALGDSAKGVGTIVLYTSPLGRYYSWTIDIAGNAILQESPSALGFSDEGTISGIPASVSVGLKRTYIFDVNTLAGNVNLSAMNVVTGVPDGAELIFRNTGENNILFDQNINGSTVQYTASGAGSTLRIFYSSSGTGNHQAG